MTGPAKPDGPPTGPPASARLLLSCADRPGIVAAVSSFLERQGANIFQSDQYSTDPEGGAFFMRVEFHLEGIDANRDAFEAGFADVAGELGMEWRISYTTQRKRIAVLVSRYDHCLLDLLWRWRRGELDCDIGLVVSNHPDLERDVAAFDVPYVHVPVEKDKKAEAEARLLGLFSQRFDLLVLARYMQILSGNFLDSVKTPVINIHHSFLPAFAGADPYARARERGREADRRHRALRHRGAGRGPDHRAGRGARDPSRQRRDACGDGAGHRANSARARREVAPRGPRPRLRHPHGRLLGGAERTTATGERGSRPLASATA